MKRNLFVDIPNEITLHNENFDNEILAKKIAIDVGCGHGDFIIDFAPKYPDKLYVGIEIARKRAHKTAQRLAKRNLSNFCVINAPGEFALKMFPDSSVDEAHINFPDPWMRARQWKNRILKPSLLIDIIRTLKPKGVLNFVTDVKEYAEYAAELIGRFPGLKNKQDRIIKKNLYESFPTLFYRKMSPLRDINYIAFEKTASV